MIESMRKQWRQKYLDSYARGFCYCVLLILTWSMVLTLQYWTTSKAPTEPQHQIRIYENARPWIPSLTSWMRGSGICAGWRNPLGNSEGPWSLRPTAFSCPRDQQWQFLHRSILQRISCSHRLENWREPRFLHSVCFWVNPSEASALTLCSHPDTHTLWSWQRAFTAPLLLWIKMYFHMFVFLV